MDEKLTFDDLFFFRTLLQEYKSEVYGQEERKDIDNLIKKVEKLMENA